MPSVPTSSPVLTQAQEQNDLEREIRAELLEKSEQAIEDRIMRLQWDQVQELCAGILRAMGYRTTVSQRGSDRGVDVFASPDGLGLEEPRIFVEVKHRPNTTMGSQDIRSFIGGRSAGDRCLYVSTGGYTKRHDTRQIDPVFQSRCLELWSYGSYLLTTMKSLMRKSKA